MAMAALFRKTGFDVISSRLDPNVLDFRRLVREFMFAARSADTAIIYWGASRRAGSTV
jgi:hypothetical protein